MPVRKAAAVSMDPEMFEEAKARAHALGFSTFSAYVVQLMREDLRRRGVITIEEDASPPPPPPKRAQKKKVKAAEKNLVSVQKNVRAKIGR